MFYNCYYSRIQQHLVILEKKCGVEVIKAKSTGMKFLFESAVAFTMKIFIPIVVVIIAVSTSAVRGYMYHDGQSTGSGSGNTVGSGNTQSG